MDLIKEVDGWIEFKNSTLNPSLLKKSIPAECERLSLVSDDFFSGKTAKSLGSFQSLRELRVWCDAGRTSIRHLLNLKSLEKIYLSGLRPPGRKLRGFEDANNLKEFRCVYSMNPSDLSAIAKSTSIEDLGAQGSIVDTNAIERILQMPNLTRLNLEATNLDDVMASLLASSTVITELDVGGSNLTEIGFKEICRMRQLVSLDAWALGISEQNLDELVNLKNLEYLSVGGYDDQDTLTAVGVISRLDNIPSLKRIWLDGISVNDSQREYLDEKYDFVSVS